MLFSNKTVIITGAAKGIGKGVALAFAPKGASIVIADIDSENGEKTASQINASGGNAIFVTTDVRVPSDIENLMQIAINKFNNISILINNAGFCRWISPYELPVEEWDDIINTNLRGTDACFGGILHRRPHPSELHQSWMD